MTKVKLAVAAEPLDLKSLTRVATLKLPSQTFALTPGKNGCIVKTGPPGAFTFT